MTAITPTPAARHRFHLLDGLRGVAAVIVLLWHAPAYFDIARYLHGAYLAVDFFFCLSGFILAFSYTHRVRNGLGLGRFALLRLIRLYPIYAFAVLLTLLFGLFHYQPPYLVPAAFPKVFGLYAISLCMLPGYAFDVHFYLFPLDPPAWSLFYELLVNIAFGWLLVKNFASPRIIAALTLVAFLAMAVCLHSGDPIYLGSVINPAEIRIGILRTLLSFLLGVLVFYLHSLYPRASIHGWLAPGAILLSLVLLLVAPRPLPATPAFQLFTVAVFFPLMVYFGAQTVAPRSWHWLCTAMGELSYPLYLLHWITLFFFVGMLSPPALARFQPYRHGLLALATLTLMLLSYAVAKLMDEPIRRLLSRKLLSSAQRPAT